VSVFGRFHAFYLAYQLHKRGRLSQLITTYPVFEVAKYGIPPDKVTSLVSQEIAFRGWSRLNRVLKLRMDPDPWFHERFDEAASRHFRPETDIYVGWSSFSERGLRRAHEHGAVTILERGSAHIEHQRDLLLEEYARCGVAGQLPAPDIVGKELREYQLADYISIPSGFVKRTFLDKGFPEDRLLRVPYGVNLSEFRQAPRQDDTFRVVFVGSMSLRKGVHYLLQAYAELGLRDAELWLIGNLLPEMEHFFRRYEGRFRYFGHLPQSDLFRHLSQASVFALCSIEEGMAMVQAQAMACGLPLICTTNTGGEDLIEDGQEGFIVPIRDVAALKEKILYFYDHPEECRRMGQLARRKVSEGLTWDSYGERMCAEYGRILSGKTTKNERP
jgi:glycosyltransferase involved in cell wall biosynthesis